jgi:succinate-semialdehyde dehydrogenase/glutarate-semialdehyde dehydrogenase
MMISRNPATEAVLGDYPLDDAATVNRRLDRAVEAQRHWRKQRVSDRAALLRKLAEALRADKQGLARLITLEMGKPIAEAIGEIDKCALTCDFYAEQAAGFLADEPVASSARDSRVVFDPLGLLLAVMPWNYPFWQAFRAIVPAIAAGNGVVLKHASNVPQCAIAIQQIFKRVGAPAGLFTTLLVDAGSVQGLIEDPRIAALTFTGSTPVGRTLAAQAGRALKKQVLELGGSDPFIVLADADIGAAATAAAKARFSNTGQSCISSKRFIVEAAVGDRFVDAFCEAAGAYLPGDPLSSSYRMGPLARGNLRDDLHAQVQATVREGATLRIGGEPLSGPGYFYPPTILDHVARGMTAAREETFGPAAAIIRARDAEEAIAIANGTEFGLGAALWTGDAQKGHSLAREIDAGAVFINAVVASDPRLPFGGVKQSGYGRELGIAGLREFTNVKTVWTG